MGTAAGVLGARRSAAAARRRTLNASFVAAAVAWTAVAVGAAVRVQQYLARRSLWLDEAMLAVSIVGRDFAGLLEPLDFDQGAPVGFLWLERAAVVAFGNNEHALRLVPLAAGLAALPVFLRLARRLLPPVPAAAATTLFAVAPAAVHFSTQVKQYSSDVLLALFVLSTGLAVATSGPSRRRLARFAGGGAVALWFAQPVVLVLAGVSAALVLLQLLDRQWRRAALVAAACGAWVASLGANYAVSLRRLAQNEALRDFWAAGFAPRPLRLGSALSWAGSALPALFADPGGLAYPLVGAAAFAVGVGVLFRREARPALVVVSPVLVAIAVALLGVYPAEGRLATFLVPVMLLGIGACLAAARRPGRAVAALAVGLLALAPLARFAGVAAHPLQIDEVRPVLEAVARRLEPGDAVYLYHGAEPAYRYYAPRLGLRAERLLLAQGTPGSCADAPLLPLASGARRIWVVFGHRFSTAPPDEERVVLSHLDPLGTPLGAIRRHGASAHLYDVSAPPVATAPPPRTAPGIACVESLPPPDAAPTGLRSGLFGSGRPA